jgi:hypothetical protein
MSDDYTTYVGARRAKTPAPNWYEIPHWDRKDDGRVILHAGDMTPVCSDCGRGHLIWAEADVPWHRICDVCGSHWDLHPITWGPARPMDPSPMLTGRYLCGCEDPALTLVRWVDGRGEIPLDPQERLDAECDATWGDLVAQITPAMWAAAERNRGGMAGQVVVPCAWARRARFYDGR